ncbi:molybdopterin-dependent oxidoreductase [Desulfovibrio aminophilus]|uniref:molybdopterin-dependent oxidoreductase n=1 Tax=Desulfovibrio aminophilus TaxID=81425 RepID=UPI00040C745D|nr:molybdopterin-dependent oxidoreductase [Desulfovibrio aminophilus]
MDAPRRSLLKWLGAGALALGGWCWGLLPESVRAAINDRFPTRTVDDDVFRFDARAGEVVWPGNRREPYVLRLDGLLESPRDMTWDELRALPRVERIVDFHCVEGWSVQDVPWGGVDFKSLFDGVRPLPTATHVVFHSLGKTKYPPEGTDHYIESFPIAELLRPDLWYMLALELEGQPLPHERGAPARVVCPFDLAYKSIKFVTRVEFTDRSVPGWWTRANPIYPVRAPVPVSRLRVRDPRRS